MGRRFISLLLFSCVLLSAAIGTVIPVLAASNQQAEPPIIPGELVIEIKAGYRASALSLPMSATIATTSPELDQLHAAVINVPVGQEQNYILKLLNTKGIQSAELNYRVTTEALPVIPDDPFWTKQYGPEHIQAPQAWSLTTGSSSVTLAIIDSGIDASHPEFSGRLVPGYDFVEHDSTPQDDCGHGTHVAGIAAATGNNGIGSAGIDWNVKIMPIRVLDGYCNGSTVDVAEALVWAVERGARIINVSLGTSAPSTLMESGTYYAYTHGAAIFAAAGNSGNALISYPAAYPWVMAVGATDENDHRADYSSTGAALDLMAPGSNIYSTTPFGNFYYHNYLGTTPQYGYLSGTSMAAPHASGAAALLASLPQFDTPDKIYQALTSTALDLDTPGRDNNTGYGLIQIADALAFIPTIQPTPTPFPPATSYALLDSRTCGNQVKYSWLDATPARNWLPVFGNDGYATVPLPFPFTFGDQAYNSVTVSANGYLTFGGNGTIHDNFIIPSIAQPNNFLAPFWDDLNPSAGGLLYQQTFGTSPNRQYVVEWSKVPRAGSNIEQSSLTFEVVLYEGSNQALFQYQTLFGALSDGSSATIGVEYADGTAGLQYAYDQPGALTSGMALLFVPYPAGDTPPSNNCKTYTRPADGSGGFFDPRPFCVEIPAGALKHPATLQILNLLRAPALPDGLASVGHFADIRLSFSPGVPLSPMPDVNVCYHYTASDLLQAGGHPENLFLAAYDSNRQVWDILPTTANPAQQLLSALAPHLSIYTVVFTPAPKKLPITGAFLPLDWLSLTFILIVGIGLACLVMGLRRFTKRTGRQ